MRTSRLWRALALLFAFGLLAAACGSDSDDTATGSDEGSSQPESEEGGEEAGLPDLGGREVTIAVENAYLPFNYLDPATGEPTGWDYAVIDEMCERLNCTPVYEAFPWEPMIQAVADGQFDMAADGITINEERAEIVAFSDGYINVDQRLLVQVGEDRFADETDFAAGDFLVGTQVGTTNFNTAVDLVGEDRVKGFDDFGFVVQAVISGDVDAVIIDETAGQGYVGENADAVEMIGDSLSSDQLGFIFPLDSDIVDAINAVLVEMKADGSLETISAEYFGDAFSITYDDLVEYPEYEEEG
ncbi:MAG: amino acid ABC transporter substrate-binding protein [Actinomycetia bacterium]|nr:amino acid ABC transporter substrate-binding protein [Actinomycetes bacterium]